jgi:hypothetical protein
VKRLTFEQFVERPPKTTRRGFRLGWLLRYQVDPPYHYDHRWFQAHVLSWNEGPARKVQFELKTYRTAGGKSVYRSKRYVRFQFCL